MKIRKEEDNLLYLDHIILSLGKIQKYSAGIKDAKAFYDNDMAYDATVRHFEIAGEAANRLSNEFKEKYAHIDWSKAISMRNILIHEYDNVDSDIVWNTIKTDIPVMLEQVKQLLKQLDK